MTRTISSTNYKSRESIAAMSGLQTISVTPTIAGQWLKWNTGNRNPKDNHVNALASRMEKGEWMLNGQAIIFDNTGQLLDGQHRLLAVVKFGEPVLFDVRFGVDPESFRVIDDGMKRTAGDVMDINGVPYPKTAAAAVKRIINYYKGMTDTRGNTWSNPSNNEQLDFYNSNPIIADCVEHGLRWYHISDRLVSASDFSAYYFLMRKKNEHKAHEFLQGLADGVGLQVKSPVYQLRKRLVAYRMDKNVRVKASIKLALISKAWNLFLRDEEVGKLIYTEREEIKRF